MYVATALRCCEIDCFFLVGKQYSKNEEIMVFKIRIRSPAIEIETILFMILLTQFFMFAVENESHCDFVKLREMLIRTNMEDMREKTHTKHYELYRKRRLEQVNFNFLYPALIPVLNYYE